MKTPEEVHKGEEGMRQTEKSSCIDQNSFRLERLFKGGW